MGPLHVLCETEKQRLELLIAVQAMPIVFTVITSNCKVPKHVQRNIVIYQSRVPHDGEFFKEARKAILLN